MRFHFILIKVKGQKISQIENLTKVKNDGTNIYFVFLLTYLQDLE